MYKLIKEHENRLLQESMTDFKVNTVQGNKPPQTTTEIQKDFNEGKISREEFLEKMDIASKYEAAKAKAQNDLEKLNEQNYADSLVGKLYQSNIPLHPADNAIAKNSAYQQVMEKIKNPKLLDSTLKAIDQIFNDGLNGKGIFDTPEGQQIKKWFNDNFRNKAGEIINLDYDAWFWAEQDDEDSQEFQKERYYELVSYAAKLIQNGYSAGEVIEKVEEEKKKFTADNIKGIFDKITERHSKKQSSLISAADKHINSQKDK